MNGYPRQARRLWRWVDAPQDAEVAGFVALQAVLGADERARDLSEADRRTLITFARRIALATLRTGDPAALDAAFEALAVVGVERVDERDAALVAYAAYRVGATQSAGEIDLSGDWGMREVSTPDGVVLVRDDGGRYPDGSDLAVRALRAADLLEAGWYVDAEITVGTSWPLGDRREEPRRSLVAVAGVRAEREHWRSGHFALLFLAEAATAQDASTVAGAGTGPARLAVAAGHRCALLIARSPAGVAPVETAASLERFRQGLADLLS
ncbi:hypothetical protein GCM10011609_08830 [Lentzea pudingi]|uniref:Uncharacterized protein n=1 Tax=Lentzea pudingi TaxID=1789439 RepID=A0ABQ2HC10_9PSEU|nr:hypothetical protein [Lentzea pudingi]GGM75143.1 hypothetical protein GCM10011609_08830 [Lentzea pudingi]